MNRLLGVRREDGRVVWMGFATLLTIVASHAVLETARDALFLADLPVSRLPWAYLGIAGLAFVAVRGSARLLAGRAPGRVLAVMLVAGAVGTTALWRLVATATPASLMGLYIWTGVLASVVVTQFWVQLATQMDVGQAKRSYAIIAAGGMLGATVGSLLAGAALTVAEPRTLLPLAAGMFLVAAGLPAFVQGTEVPMIPPAADTPEAEERPGLAAVWGDPYLKRILLLAIVGPVVAMGIDFIFKSIVSHDIPRAALGPFFARYNAIVNGAALVFQLTLAPRLLQSIGVVRNLCLLPGALGLVAAGVAGATALPAALILRGTDGILRHSLHRAATEILFLPLSTATRSALRGLAESIGQRGGQVLGSTVILLAIGVGATPRDLALGVAVLCGLWLFGYLRLTEHYVQRFRSQLQSLGGANDAGVPALDLQSLEILVAGLSAPDDAEVIAALDLLSTYGRVRLVSPLILYHPSPAVVLRALELFDGEGRDDVHEMRRRLLEHRDPAVRAMALRGLVATGDARSTVRTLLRRDPSPLVRRTALVLWMGFDDTRESDLNEAVADLVALSDPESRLAVASALGGLPVRVRLPVARALLADATPVIRRQVARTLATAPDDTCIDLLTDLLAFPECRADARAGLLAVGETALEHLGHALESTEMRPAVRRHIPRTISRFGSARAAAILVARLAREQDGRVIYKILRGLGRMRANDPAVPVDRPTLVAVAETNLRRMIELLAYHVAHELRQEAATAGDGTLSSVPQSTDVDLLGPLLVEKEQRALERVCRVLQILESEDFATIFAAVCADTPAVRESGRELIGHALDGRFRDALLALTDSLPPAERLDRATSALPIPVAEAVLEAWRTWKKTSTPSTVAAALAAIVEAMCTDQSKIFASVARHQLRPHVTTAPREPSRVASC